MNKKTVALTEEEYRQSINLMRDGFMLDGVSVRPNNRIATLEVIQASLGLRLGDVLRLKMSSFIRDGERWRLDFTEEKTGKKREFTVPNQVYHYIQEYAYKNGISEDSKLFDLSERQVERHLNKVFMKMGKDLRHYGSHSYRKYFGTRCYLENENDIVLVQELLQHSSPATTRRYITISRHRVEQALEKTVGSLI